MQGSTTKSTSLTPFDPKLETRLLCDASRLFGFGFILIQRLPGCTDRFGIIRCGSCSLNPAQRNYSVVELEAVVVNYGVLKCTYFLHGCPFFECWSDHKPLAGVLKKEIRDVSNPRLAKIRENLQMFNFVVLYVPGKENIIADCLSRRPLLGPMEESENESEDNTASVRMTHAHE